MPGGDVGLRRWLSRQFPLEDRGPLTLEAALYLLVAVLVAVVPLAGSPSCLATRSTKEGLVRPATRPTLPPLRWLSRGGTEVAARLLRREAGAASGPGVARRQDKRYFQPYSYPAMEANMTT